MDLKKAKKVSRILMNCLMVLNVFVLGGVILFALGSVLVWLLPIMADKINPYHMNIQIQGLKLLVADEIFSIPAISIGTLLGTVKMIALFLTISYSRRIFKRILLGETPFQYNIAKDIRLIGIFLMIYQFIWSWENGFLQMLLALVIPLILFCISFVFEYGCALQKEIDETL